MGSYSAIARVDRPTIRAAWDVDRTASVRTGAEAAVPLEASRPIEPAIELDDPGDLASRFADLRAAWSQTTFFLFSADSWR